MRNERYKAKEIWWFWIVLGPAFFPWVMTGCLYFGGGHRTEFADESRIPIRFANVEASHDFHEGLRRSDRGAYTDGGGFVLLFVAAGGGAVYHETAHYNAQVRLADVDRNGEITEEEARAYREYVESTARETEE